MKIRTDFVSNSSSCSFIIENINKMFSILKAFEDIEIPYSFEDELSIRISVKYKNYKKLKNIISSENDEYDYLNEIDEHLEECIKKYPDDIYQCGIYTNLNQLINLCCKNNEEIKELIENIDFSSENYGYGLINLKLLYNFFEKNNCNPNDKDSELPFNNDRNSTFIKMLNSVIKE